MAQMIMDAERPQDLQTAGWRPRRVNGVSSSLSPSPKAEEDQCPSSKTERKNSFLRRFCPSQAFNGLDEAHPHWEGNLLYPVCQSKC